MKNFIFNNEDTGQVWSVNAPNKQQAELLLPEDAEWDDYFERPVPDNWKYQGF
jgi:hypothetical protein